MSFKLCLNHSIKFLTKSDVFQLSMGLTPFFFINAHFLKNLFNIFNEASG